MKIYYLRNKNGFPVGCVASSLVDEEVWFGVSSYNPSDKFSKKLARETAMERLRDDSIPVPIQPGRGETKALIMATIAASTNLAGVSQTSREAAKLWLEEFEYIKYRATLPEDDNWPYMDGF